MMINSHPCDVYEVCYMSPDSLLYITWQRSEARRREKLQQEQAGTAGDGYDNTDTAQQPAPYLVCYLTGLGYRLYLFVKTIDYRREY